MYIYQRPSYCNQGQNAYDTRPFNESFYTSIQKQINLINQGTSNSGSTLSSWMPSSETLMTIGRVLANALEIGMKSSCNANKFSNSSSSNYQYGFNYNNQTKVTVNKTTNIVTEAERKQKKEKQKNATRVASVIFGLGVAVPAAHQATKGAFEISKINARLRKLDKFRNSFTNDRISFPNHPVQKTIDKAIDKRSEALHRERSYAIAKLTTLVCAVAAGAFLAISAIALTDLMALSGALFVPTAIAMIVTWTAAGVDSKMDKCNQSASQLFQNLLQAHNYQPQYSPVFQPTASAPLFDEEVIFSDDGKYTLADGAWQPNPKFQANWQQSFVF